MRTKKNPTTSNDEKQEKSGSNGSSEEKIIRLSFDCPTNLKKAFLEECKSNGKSVCNELKKFMTYYIPKNSSNHKRGS